MIVAFDATVLVYLLDDKARPPIDLQTGKPVPYCAERVKALIEELQHDKAKIVVPTPSLAEVLVKAQQAAPTWLAVLNASKHFRVAPFDERAAVEFAAMQANKQAGRFAGQSRQKAKFDDQIVAIAAIEGAEVIYSDDVDIKKLAGDRFKVLGIADLPLPEQQAQGSLFASSPYADDPDFGKS